jgi:hypothetical protein
VIVSVNLFHVMAVSAVAMILCGFIGYASGLKDGYLRGQLDAWNRGKEKAP